jgi:hypothetical protein
MAVTYSTAAKNARLEAVKTLLEAGSGAAQLVIGTSSLSGATGVLAEIPLDDPCGSVAAGVLTFSGLPNTVIAAATGTAAKAELRDSDDNTIVSGLTVGTAGTDIIIQSTAIAAGQTIQINSGAITHAA